MKPVRDPKHLRQLWNISLSIALAHTLITFVHGWAHSNQAVILSPVQIAFVLGVITAMPWIGLGLARTSWSRAGWGVLLFSSLGAFLFGFINHFLLSGPDHICSVMETSGGWTFRVSAVLLAVTELMATAYAWVGFRSRLASPLN